MDTGKLRAWYWQRQGLDGSLAGVGAAEVLERTGWARSVGGVGPYLTLWARARIGRAAVDRALEELRIHELPAARACTYVVPRHDFALALTVGQPFGGGDAKTAVKLGVTEQEIARLCDAVLRALEPSPLDPEAIREAVGASARSLGEAGKKKGFTTTLPIALGALQRRGEIRRIPVNGRLDQQRYQYGRWPKGPLAEATIDPAEAQVELARRYFRWIGPATLGELRWFSGLGAKAAAEAVRPLGLVPAEPGSDRLLLPEDRAAFEKVRAGKKPAYALVAGLDGILLLRRELGSLIDPADAKRPVFVERGRQALGTLADLPSHAILDRGRLVGLWEFDVEASAIAWTSFVKPDPALRAAVEETEAFVRDQLGDARSLSLDSPKSRAPRVAALRAS
jgi:hypothetical protein